MTHDCNALHNDASQAHCSTIQLHNWLLQPDRAMLAARYGWLTVITRREHAGRMALAAVGLFGDPDSIERLASVLLGPDSQGGATTVVLEVRDQVSQTVAGLVPHEWSGEAADAFARL